MDKPLVSVAVITYNQSGFLRELLESILAQDYEPIEIVVADDGSTDDTRAVLDDFSRAHPGKLKLVLSETNAGITKNSNKALEACTGKYVAWIGGDDRMLPGKLHTQARFMEEHPECSLSYHDLRVFNSTDGRTIRFFNSGPGSARPREGDARQLLLHGSFCASPSIMARRDACPREFDTRVRVASDWLFWIETSLNGAIRFVPGVWGEYRRHDSNASGENSRTFADELVSLAILEERHPSLHSAIRRARAMAFYRRAIADFAAGNRSTARLRLIASMREALVSWKLPLWYVRSFF